MPSRITSDLSILALDRLAQPLVDHTELPKLMRAAIDRGLSSVIILDARLTKPVQAHVSLQRLVENHQSDIVIQRLPNTKEPSLVYCSYLIRPAAFETVARCFELGSEPSLRAISPKLTVSSLPEV